MLGFGTKKSAAPQQEGCPNKETCPLFPLFQMETTTRIWMTHYCNSDYAVCERYVKMKQGMTIPDNLLPNGDLINS